MVASLKDPEYKVILEKSIAIYERLNDDKVFAYDPHYHYILSLQISKQLLNVISINVLLYLVMNMRIHR
jgi:hypothetical protein